MPCGFALGASLFVPEWITSDEIEMQTRLKMSRDGLELLKEFEGLRLTAVRLPDGRWTMGHGHTQHAREGVSITAADAEALLLYDLIPVAAAVNDAVGPQISQNQFDALVCFAFNVGVEAFRDSEVLRRVNQERMTEAALAMAIWRAGAFNGRRVVLDALVRRRTAEEALLLGDGRPSSPSDLIRPEIDPAAQASLPVTPPAEVAVVQVDEAVEARLVEAVITPEFPREVVTAEPDVPVEPIEQPQDEVADTPSAETVPSTPETSEAVRPAGAETGALSHLSMSAQIYGTYSTQSFSPPSTVSPEPEPEQADAREDEGDAAPVEGDGPPLVLVLTSPPEAAVDTVPQVYADEVPPAEVDAQDGGQAPLFEGAEDTDADVIFYESEDEEGDPSARWSDTGAYIATGAVGLAAFGFGIAGFHLAGQEPPPPGFFDEKTAISWVLVAIGVVCVWISAYSLFKRLGGSDAE